MWSANMLWLLAYVLCLLYVSSTADPQLLLFCLHTHNCIYLCVPIYHQLQLLNSFFFSVEEWELRGIRDSGVYYLWYTIAEWRTLLIFTSSTAFYSAMQMVNGFHCALWKWLVWCKIDFRICTSLLVNRVKRFALCCHSTFESVSWEPWFFLCEAALHSATRYSIWKMNSQRKLLLKIKYSETAWVQLQVAVKWPFLHKRCSVWMREKLKSKLVCKLLPVRRGGVHGNTLSWVFSRAVVNTQSLTGCSG